MHRRNMRLIISFIATALSSSAGAADLKAGAKLHQDKCMQCHDSGVYTREQRRVTSLQGLREQVKRCELSLGLTWFDDQIEDVVQYLNDSYYNFAEAPP